MRKAKMATLMIPALMVISLASIMTAPTVSAGKTIYVSDYRTIQEAIDAAEPGDTVLVGPRTYTANIVIDKWLTLQGAGSGTDPSSNTVITSASPDTPVINIQASGNSETERLVIKDLRVTGAIGAGHRGAGISNVWMVSSVSHITFSNVASVGNKGHGISFDTYSINDIVLNNCILSGNGIHGFSLPSTSTASEISVNDCVFDNNVQGGIMSYAYLDGLTVSGSTFTNNGFGIMLGAESSKARYIKNVDINTSTFDNNNKDPYQLGFWVYVWGSTEHEIENIEVHNCSITNHNNYGVGFSDSGLAGYGDVVIDATHNWWGTTDMIFIAHSVSSKVYAEPWLDGSDGNPVSFIGPQGIPGTDGADGKDGADGALGSQGPQGPTGKKGDTGNTGSTGATGATGSKGDTGTMGSQGVAGPAGAAETVPLGISAIALVAVILVFVYVMMRKR